MEISEHYVSRALFHSEHLMRPTMSRKSTISSAADGHLIGYARVSSSDQDTSIQSAKLKAAGCTIIRSEKASGRTRAGRDELSSIIEFIRSGDTLVVAKLDRLGRSTRDVLNIVHELEQRGASLRVLERSPLSSKPPQSSS